MEINTLLDLITTIGTVILTITGIYTVKQFVSKKVYYGDKSVEEFNKMKLEEKDLKDNYEYSGGRKIFPQIIIERRFLNKTVTYYVIENNKRMVKVWYLK